jgi:hypothetical protein
MNNFFSGLEGPAFDFIQISAGFLLTMLVFFESKNKKTLWLNYLLLTVFVFQCLLVAVFHDGLTIKMFAVLMLISVLGIEFFTIRKWKRADSEPSTTK